MVQWAEEGIREVHVEVRGDISEHFHPISAAVLKGILEEVVDFPVNIINASYVAKDRGIKVEELSSEETPDFKHYIKVVIRANGTEKIVGILLVFENKDVPGVIGRIGSILGSAKVNIAGFRLGRERKGGIALGILNLDDEVPEHVLEDLKSIPEILFVKQVIL